MRLRQAREEAKRMTVPKRKRIGFEMMDEHARAQKCVWIDPAAGTFRIKGNSGFSTVDDFNIHDPQVINMKLED